MKKIFKFFPAALAVMALASCSDIDAPEQNGAYTTSEKGDLVVEVEPFDNISATRALRDADGGGLTFENGDAFKVYDDELYKYDVYKFNNDAFYLEGSKILQNPKYGLFPAENVVRGYYDRDILMTVGEFAIPHVISYDASAEQKIGDKVYYAANLPMFGLASFNSNKVYVSKLRHLVSVLKIELENVKDNATFLKLSCNKPLTGTFVAELDASSEDARKAVALKPGKSDLIVYNEMYIDLSTIPNRKGVLYIPIIPGYEANKVAMKLEYTSANDADADGNADDAGATASTIAALDALPISPIYWSNTGLMFPKEVFGVNQLKSASWSFELTDMTPNKVSALLDAYKTSEDDIEFELADVFTIGTEANYGTTIAIPQLKDGVDVTVSLGEDFDEWDNGTTGTAAPLVIADADPAKPFKGTFVLNVGDILDGSHTTEDAGDLEINLPEATVQIVGDYTTTDILSGGATGALTLTAAKKVIFGDENVAPTETEIAAGTYFKTLVDVSGTGMTLTEDVKAIEIAKYTSFTGDIDETAPNAVPVDFELTVSGALVGNVDLSTAFGSEVTVNSNFSYFLAADAADKTAITGNVTTGGDIEIALGAEGEAISGTLKMTGARSDINLKQGYINTLTIDVTNNGEWENYCYANLNLGTSEGLTAINAVTEAAPAAPGQGGYFKVKKSVWNGSKISDVAYTTSGVNYYDAYTTFTELDKATKTPKAAVNTAIFTASQFASFNGIGSNAFLCNDLDLNTKAWTGYAIKGVFEGNEHTISNLALNAGAGLFASTTAAATVQNLTISGVTVPAATTGTNVGGLLATTANNVTANKLTITGINIDNGGSKALSNVGGLIGNVTAGTITLTDVYVDGAIKGYSNLGGLLGTISGGSVAATAGKYSALVAITNNFKTGNELDMPLAKIGGFVGSISTITTLTFAAPKADPIAPVHAYPTFEVMSNINAEVGNRVWFTAEQPYVGFSGQKAIGAAIGSPVAVTATKAGATTATTYYASPTGYENTVATVTAAGVTSVFGANQACLYTVK